MEHENFVERAHQTIIALLGTDDAAFGQNPDCV
jgi:hypothetical protein